MIVKMKKLTLMVASGSESQALKVLRSLGLVHVTHMQKPSAHYINYIEHKLGNLDKALSIMSDAKVCKEIAKEEIPKYIKEIIASDKEKRKFQVKLEEFNQRKEWFNIFGDVSEAAIEELKASGIFLRLYSCDKSLLKSMPKDKLIYVVGKKGSQFYIAHFATDEKDLLKFTQVRVAQESLRSLTRKIHHGEKGIEAAGKRLEELSACRENFTKHKKELIKALKFCNVRFGMFQAEGIQCLRGFCPKEGVKKITQIAKDQGWAVVVEEPKEQEAVPTLIRNPKWVGIIKPVFKFIGTIPGYKEYDISFWFLIFFSIFFAMLVGDAGYGLIFLGITFFAQRKFKRAQQDIFSLFYLLSGATVVWGALTGTWFGSEKIGQLPFLSFLVRDNLNSFKSSNQIFMVYLCFFIGAIHLTIAHAIKVFRFVNSRRALSQIGWIFIVWSVFFVAGKLVLNKEAPTITATLFIVGVSLVILFSYPKKNIFKGALLALADLPLKIINSFSDVVSYLRLFAVGYATVAVAMAFNNMALASGINSIFSGIGAALILFLGHALNILLALMAVVVHGIRLNMLEFSGHLDMEWSGIKYEPFKE